jgi:pyruvate dehydrogenase E2 component (dihydrolipoamide acetyltransferase)
MAHDIVLPRLGWGMETGKLVEWLKKEGEEVKSGDLLFVVEGDKATQDVEALDSGILHISPNCPPPGTEVAVGTLLAYLLAPGESSPVELSGGQSLQPPAAESKGAPVEEHIPQLRQAVSESPRPSAQKAAKVTISPRARRVARELGVSWESLKGSGRTGRIIERDIRAFSVSAVSNIASSELPQSTLRRITAEHVSASARTAVPVTLFCEADATDLVGLIKTLKKDAELYDGVFPTYNDVLVKLAAQALSTHPALNARMEGESIIHLEEINVGIAVDTDKGLLVPVVHQANQKGLRQISIETADLIAKARAGSLKLNEMSGGTFTLTNLGMYDIDGFTPVINLPECAILGVGKIASKVVVIDEDTEETAVRKRLVLSLTFDHRLVDGAPAARFLKQVKGLIEHPTFWLFG